MKVRRSLTSRKTVTLPRGIRRTRSATALLLSFALLCTTFSLSAPLRPPRAGAQAPLSSSGRPSHSNRGPGLLARDDAGPESLTRSADKPFPTHSRMRPNRTLEVVGQENSASVQTRSALLATRLADGRSATRARVADDQHVQFLSQASTTSRTRGPPATGC